MIGRDLLYLIHTWDTSRSNIELHNGIWWSLCCNKTKIQQKSNIEQDSTTLIKFYTLQFLAIYVDAVVILLKKCIVEENFINDSIGKIIEIVYDNPDRPNIPGALPMYIVIPFPECTLNHSSMPTKYLLARFIWEYAKLLQPRKVNVLLLVQI